MTASQVELKIESMAFGGKGIARKDGMVYFVQNAIEGDLVLGDVVGGKKRYSEVIAREILQASPYRVEPPCAVQNSCGGCQLMIAQYQRQLLWKKQFIEAAFQRIGKQDVSLSEVFPSPNIVGYRNRIFLRARCQGLSLELGYISRDQRTVIPLPNACPIAEPAINKILHEIGQLKMKPSWEGRNFRLQLQRLRDAQSSSELVAILLYPNEGPRADLSEIADFLRQELPSAWVGFAQDTHKAPIFAYDRIGELRYLTKPGIFQQVNRAANALVLESVHRHIRHAKPTRVLDLCCGSGNLSLQPAREGVQVTGVESNPLSIAVAKENLKINDLANAEYFAQDSLRFLRQLKKDAYDLILVDPPREGLKEGMNDLKHSGAKQIIYLSCDPATLARDIAMLAPIYRVKEAEAFDFFPHTWHVETLLFLEKS